VLERAGLVSRLGDGVPLTLISAPAGAGKTTLLAEWHAAEAESRGFAWLTLDRGDNDRTLFWSAVLSAVRGAVSEGSARASSSSAEVVPLDSLTGRLPLAELERVLARASRPVWVFLDDLHEVHAADVLADLDALLRTPPDGLLLVLASRRDPALALHRLRLAGRLREIRAGDLAFERSEVRQILVHHGVVLGEAELSLLVDRTEGWAAGVRLAALALADAEDPRAVVQSFAGDDRAVADYLAAEVLARLSARERRLLRLCALPEQLTGELAVAVTGDPSAGDLLEELYRDNVLVVRLAQPGGWYRIHTLLRSYLLAEVQRDPSVPAAHRRTARWFAEHGHLEWAIDHAVRSGDDDLAVEMLTTHGPSLLADGRARTLHSVIAAGSERVRADAAVRRLETLAVLEVEEMSPQRLPLPRHAAHDQLARFPAPDAGADPLDALVALHRARHDPMSSADALEASAAVGDAREDDLGLLVTLNRGMVLLLAGRLDEAVEVFERASSFANPLGLFSEDVDPDTGTLLGNFPQAYTHVGLISAALPLEERAREAP